jgi:hypothetical protein
VVGVSGYPAGRLVQVHYPGPIAWAVNGQARRNVRALPQRRQGHVAFRLGSNKELGLTIVQDVGKFIRRKIGINAGIVQSQALARGTGLDVAHVVLEEDRAVVQTVKAAGTKEVSKPVEARFEFGIRHDLAGLARISHKSQVHQGSE